MKSTVLQYEVRYHGKQEWENISDLDLMQGLHESFDRVIPAIQQMLEGNQVVTIDAIYRLKGQKKVNISI